MNAAQRGACIMHPVRLLLVCLAAWVILVSYG